MKERINKIIKWFFIALGIIFFIQILVVATIYFVVKKFETIDINKLTPDIGKPKEFSKIINYAQDYYNKNGKYPENIDNIKKKKDLIYKYETTKDSKCYSITIKSEKNKITKNEYTKIGILIVICIVPVFLLTVYRNNLYNQNLEDFNNIHNPKIVFEYEDKCSNNNLFYEDELYKYYFECYDATKFYAIVNDKEKLSIQKLCDDSEYLVNINRIFL